LGAGDGVVSIQSLKSHPTLDIAAVFGYRWSTGNVHKDKGVAMLEKVALP
jgi:hypothetical protein